MLSPLIVPLPIFAHPSLVSFSPFGHSAHLKTLIRIRGSFVKRPSARPTSLNPDAHVQGQTCFLQIFFYDIGD